VLGLQEIYGRHTGENQALVIIKVIAEFGIATKLGYFMIDNTTNNDTILAALLTMLLDKYNIDYNTIHYRLCCNSYIINLVAQAFLFRYNKDTFSAESNPVYIHYSYRVRDRSLAPEGPSWQALQYRCIHSV
jgi:hypothetical protein